MVTSNDWYHGAPAPGESTRETDRGRRRVADDRAATGVERRREAERVEHALARGAAKAPAGILHDADTTRGPVRLHGHDHQHHRVVDLRVVRLAGKAAILGESAHHARPARAIPARLARDSA